MKLYAMLASMILSVLSIIVFIVSVPLSIWNAKDVFDLEFWGRLGMTALFVAVLAVISSFLLMSWMISDDAKENSRDDFDAENRSRHSVPSRREGVRRSELGKRF